MLKRLLVLATTALAGLAIAPISAHAAASADSAFGCASLTAMNVQCMQAQAGPVFRTYIVLPNVGGSSNFSEYTAGGASPGMSVITHYSALRIDPIPVRRSPLTFRVNIADQTFASSTGSLCHSSSATSCPAGQAVTSMPYGVAMDCMGGGSASGMANIDLRGTPFHVAHTFSTQGFVPGGSATFLTPSVVDLTGGGYCGWNAPAPTDNPFNTNPLTDGNGGWDLHLTLPY
jgi:hypothetical protein